MKMIKYKNVINILFVLSIVLAIYILNKVVICPLLLRKYDLFAQKVNNIEDYSYSLNCANQYLRLAREDYLNIKYYLHSDNEDKQKKYSLYLEEKYTHDIDVINIKKALGGIYIIYYKDEEENTVRLVLSVNKLTKRIQVLYDQLYSNM